MVSRNGGQEPVRDLHGLGLPVAAQLRALWHYAEKNGYLAASKYVDETESRCIAG